jgi:hypothetical protein
MNKYVPNQVKASSEQYFNCFVYSWSQHLVEILIFQFNVSKDRDF